SFRLGHDPDHLPQHHRRDEQPHGQLLRRRHNDAASGGIAHSRPDDFVEPELRIGWNHEFLDSSQTIGGSLLGVPGSSFSATGIDFGRDSALVGAGLSADINQNAKVFMDYDGKINAKLQEHSVSGGMRVRF
ncbi:MAG: autotransporter outer membrane beta-barrel domain-containing protein, partial [Hyphomicrobiales bacterium]|nr:autotransporter outer membrane beta-barrel domain-containing protein [Hyphomicrobiales bacterium]